MKQKINPAQIAFSGALFILLLFIIAILWALNISGPSRAYEKKITDQIQQIKDTHTAIGQIERHVFRYITYVGEDDSSYYWFNEDAQVITTRTKTTRDDAGVRQELTKQGYTVEKITLGYGYENPAYVAQCTDRIVLVDYDSKEVIYEREVMSDEA